MEYGPTPASTFMTNASLGLAILAFFVLVYAVYTALKGLEELAARLQADIAQPDMH
jgi:hypothetical protein